MDRPLRTPVHHPPRNLPDVAAQGDGAHEEILQRAPTREQDLALVGEVAEERPLRDPCPLSA
jgi:hypothetical protein